ncbi:MAG: sodium/solute symporter [Myxococcota bacterium]
MLSSTDVWVLGIYLALTMGHGLWVARRRETSSDYFLAGRRIPWTLLGLSLFASNMSGASFIGLMGASYDHGLAVFNYEWTAAVVLILFAAFLLPMLLKYQVYTIPELLEVRFDARCRKFYSAFTILAIIFIDTAGALYAGGVVIASVTPFSLSVSVLVLASVAGVYTALGGLSAVVVTDAVQSVLLILGGALISYFTMVELGGWDAAWALVDERRRHLIRPSSDAFLPWPGIFGVCLLGFYYWALNQFVVQRALGAKDLSAGQRGALFAGLIKLPNLLIIILPGVWATALFPDLGNPDLVFPKLAFELLPAGVRSLVMVALLAAILSSLDSALNAAATLVTMDFVRPVRPRLTDDQLVAIGRVVTIVCVGISAAYAPSIAQFENLFGYFQSVLAYITPPVVASYFGALFMRGLKPSAVLLVLSSSIWLGVPLFIFNEVMNLSSIHYTYASIILFLGSLVMMAVTSVVLGGASGRNMTAPPRPTRSFVIQSGLLLMCVAGLILWLA